MEGRAPYRAVMRSSDDTAGTRPAWDPRGIVFAAFWGGPFTLVGLCALNFQRLGDSRRARLGWVFGTLGSLAWVVGFKWAEITGRLSESFEEPLVTRIATVGVGVWLAHLQGPAFERVLAIHGRAKLLGPALLAILVAVALSAALGLLLVELFQ